MAGPMNPPPAGAMMAGGALHYDVARLFFSIARMISEQPVAIQFISANPGEGTSTIARELALYAAAALSKPILLLDLDRGLNRQLSAFQQANIRGEGRFLSDPIADDRIGVSPYASTPGPKGESYPAPQLVLHRLEPTSLHIASFDQQRQDDRGRPIAPLLNLSVQSAFWEALRDEFDLVIVDSPSGNISFDGIAIGRYMNGIILVVEAETTRIPVLNSLKDRIQLDGGRIIGSVLNKRRFYIPPVIYRRL